MRDSGYSDSFLVFMTPVKGTQFVVDREMGRISSRLLAREMTASELAECLNLSLSTVQSRLETLVLRNILEYRYDESFGNRKKYRNCAALMFHNCNSSSWYYTSKESAIRELKSPSHNHHFLILSMLLDILSEYGLDFWPMIPEAGSSLSYVSKLGKDLHLDRYYQNLERFRTEYLPDTVLNIYAKEDLDIEVVSESRHSDNRTLYLGFLAGILRTILPELTGHNYHQVIHVERDTDRHVRHIRSAKFDGKQFQDSLPNVFERDVALGRHFRIYHIRGTPYLIYNEFLLRILSLLSDGPMTSKEIVSRVGCPVATAYYYLDKLEKMGAINAAGSRNRTYSMMCRCVIETTVPKRGHMEGTLRLFSVMGETERNIPLILITYLSEILECSGISIDFILKECGRFIAEQTYSSYLHMSFTEYLEFVCEKYGTVISIEWNSPIDATIHCMGNTYSHERGMILFREIVDYARPLLTGNNVSISIVYDNG